MCRPDRGAADEGAPSGSGREMQNFWIVVTRQADAAVGWPTDKPGGKEKEKAGPMKGEWALGCPVTPSSPRSCASHRINPTCSCQSSADDV